MCTRETWALRVWASERSDVKPLYFIMLLLAYFKEQTGQMGGIFQRKPDYLDLHNNKKKKQASSYFGLSGTVVAWLVDRMKRTTIVYLHVYEKYTKVNKVIDIW